MAWRVGRKIPINVYDGDRPVCQCHNAADALNIADSMERVECQDAQREIIVRLKLTLEEIANSRRHFGHFDSADAATWMMQRAKQALDHLK